MTVATHSHNVLVKIMNDYIFLLTFKLNKNEDPEQYLAPLFEAGCDDAIFGLGKKGQIDAEFKSRSGNHF